MRTSTKLAPIVLAGALVLAACGGSSGSEGSADVDATTSTTVAAASDASTTTAASGSSGASVEKVSANDASQEEIAAALDAAGVPNADRWAREVTEYRPYDDADQGFPHLREELAKYNPADGVVDQIISVLSE